ncbi:DUF2306 domain-containing protein [Xanthomonas graminis]|jgi:hypothetical protein|uniref:DUF2306 domain-containing protein n=1 Tax=Xanthomonas graminis pv. graminis TaxID=134874 RepID=A0A1M4JM71_9XANT|nr:DUF2306 domain-containing protein [Xanthomonas translucens]EKU23806.1 hypothetical protein XTG29_03407 [Xanthomonas translucens pv. graminis ART-Xtg29]UKE54145.1 DUF2306 domain-containing protein [Xanthomonas translucens pv. graminis]WIH09168.1 DUF2306 domain-containing protein [Xanthomonas translucens pv. graminis]WIH12047.1 DUF2306 domain-containing protein [Xanthomonas translucens pv. graminis]WIH15722.1 DUF2306 domain-containing protein [Xanthomonas translucens pv. graminis]
MQVDPIREGVAVPRGRPAARVGWVLLWLALAAFAAEFVRHVYLKYAALESPAYAMFLTRRGWLWCHLGGGAVGIVLGTLQFATQRWRRHAWVHRWVGRAYFAGMLVAMLGATALIATSPAPMPIRVAFAATEAAWLVVVSAGLLAIRRGQVALHQRWMLRAYLVTLAPVVFRIALYAAVDAGMAPSPNMIAALLWGSWAVPLLVDALGRWVANAALRGARTAAVRAGTG